MALLFELALKMSMTAAIVVAASVVAERSGPFVGAMIASLPTAAGAAYVILALEHPASFVADSAVGSVAANAAVALFAFTYAVLAQRRGVVVSVSGAILIWFVGVLMLRAVDWTALSAVVLNILVLAVLAPAGARYRTTTGAKVVASPLDLVWRALAVALCVVIVTTASHSIGSAASGMFAVFPVATACLLVIIHMRLGGPAAGSLAAYMPVPLIGLGLGFVAVHYLVAPIGVWWALTAGLAVCLLWSGVLWIIHQRAFGAHKP